MREINRSRTDSLKEEKKSDPAAMKNNTVLGTVLGVHRFNRFIDSIRAAEILLKTLDGGIDGQTADFEDARVHCNI